MEKFVPGTNNFMSNQTQRSMSEGWKRGDRIAKKSRLFKIECVGRCLDGVENEKAEWQAMRKTEKEED